MPQRTASSPRCQGKDIPLSLPDRVPVSPSRYPPSIPSESISKQLLRARQCAGKRQVTHDEGRLGGKQAHRCPQGATPSAGELPREQQRALARHLPCNPTIRPSHATELLSPACDVAAPPKPTAPTRAQPAGSEQRQPLAAAFAMQKWSLPPSVGQPDSAESVGTFWPPIRTSGVFGVVCSLRSKRKSSESCRRHGQRFGGRRGRDDVPVTEKCQKCQWRSF